MPMTAPTKTVAASNEVVTEENPYTYDALKRTFANLSQIEAHHAAISVPTAPGYEPSSFNHKYVTLNGFKFHYVDEGNSKGIPLILVHGFPDLWYGWRYQIRHLEKEGYRVIAIDSLGSGESDYPKCEELEDLDTYRIKKQCATLVALLDNLKLEKAVFIGRDWGASICYRIGMYFPKRILSVISVGIPFGQPQQFYITPDVIIPYFPQFQYYAAFQNREPEGWFEGDVHKQAVAWFNALYATRPGTNVQEKQYYIDQFTRTGFHGGLNYYRTAHLDHQDDLPFVDSIYTLPVLQLIIESDPILTPRFVGAQSTDWLKNLEQVRIKEGAHNVHTENPVAVNKALSDYLTKFFGKKQPQDKAVKRQQYPMEE